MNGINRKRWDVFAIIIFFLFSFNIVSVFDSLPGHALGIACLIAGLYGVVAFYKGKRFLF